MRHGVLRKKQIAGRISKVPVLVLIFLNDVTDDDRVHLQELIKGLRAVSSWKSPFGDDVSFASTHMWFLLFGATGLAVEILAHFLKIFHNNLKIYSTHVPTCVFYLTVCVSWRSHYLVPPCSPLHYT